MLTTTAMKEEFNLANEDRNLLQMGMDAIKKQSQRAVATPTLLVCGTDKYQKQYQCGASNRQKISNDQGKQHGQCDKAQQTQCVNAITSGGVMPQR